MNNLADVKKQSREERMAFRSNLASDVRFMLADFSGVRREQAQKARNERNALLLDIKNQVAGLRKATPQDKKKARVLNVKAAKPPVTAKEPRGKKEKRWLRENPGKAVAKAKRGKK